MAHQAEQQHRPRRYLVTKELCERYGKSDKTIERWVATGKLPKPLIINRIRHWLEDGLDAHDDLNRGEG